MAESFNYISCGNWELVEGEVDVVTMFRGRMFEYTPSDIEKRLERLDPLAFAYLETLPTLSIGVERGPPIGVQKEPPVWL